MQYQYAQDQNFEDYSSGRVLYARPGQPAFPVRLASEIFQRAVARWRTGGVGACTLYDPVCGGAYGLTVLALLHWQEIAAIYASDVDSDILALTRRNLSLLTLPGMEKRIAEIEGMFAQFGKTSHAQALESAQKFLRKIKGNLKSHAIAASCFQADVGSPEAVRQGLGSSQVDLVLADVPYGWHSEWQVTSGEENPISQMLTGLRPHLKPISVVAVVADKSQKIKGEGYQRLEHFTVGKRRAVLLRPNHA